MFQGKCLSYGFVAAVAGMLGMLSFLSSPQLRHMSANEEEESIAGAEADRDEEEGFGAYCSTAPFNTCTACAPYTECTLTSGGNGTCSHQGGASGCTNGNSRHRCLDSWNPYDICYNSASPCGASRIPTACIVVRDVTGVAIDCDKPAAPGCGPGGANDCTGC